MKLLIFLVLFLGMNFLQAKETLKKAKWITEIDLRISNLGATKNCFESVKTEKDYLNCQIDRNKKWKEFIKNGITYREIDTYIKKLKEKKN